MRKIRKILKYIVPMAAAMVVTTLWFGTKQATGAVQKLEEIEAYYVGAPVEVGKEVNIKDIYISAKYYVSSGQSGHYEYEDVKKGFTVTPSEIKNKGDNQIVVTYKDKNCVLTVPGKVAESITADYTGEELYIGATIPVGKINAYAYFSDGSFEKIRNFSLSSKTVTKAGVNTITVVYGGKTADIFVVGKEPLAVEELMAVYIGRPVIAGGDISKNDIEVQAIYNDGTIKPVKNFNISPSIAEVEGENEITITYGNAETVIQVYAQARYVTEMRARYIGPGVIIGKKVPKEEIEVIVTYNDGSDEAIDNYEMYGEEISFEGENMVLVYFDSFMEDIIVPGVVGFAANYDNSISDYFASPNHRYDTEVTLGMGVHLTSDKFMLRDAEEEMLQYVVQRVVHTDQFIGFELFYEDDEMVLEFPMAMKVTVPDEFDPEKFGVFYTPNKATIMAKVDGEFLDEEKTEYEFIVYEPGTYILVNEVSDRLVTEIIVQTKVKLRENRSFSLNPVVFPLNAENRELSFWSTDENVATVSPNGKIRTYSEGVCEILVEAQDDSGVSVIVTVEVNNGKNK